MPNDEELKEQNELENFLVELEDYVKNPSEYVKYEMPDFTKSFTDEEKKAFEVEYTKAVNAFNKVLSDDMKLDLDLEGFHKKINDPEQVEMYRRISFVNELSAKKDKIQKYYKSTFAQKKDNKELPLDRVITTLMRADDSKESDDFNKKLMNFYYKYPNEVSQAVLKGIFKSDSKVYEGILKDDYERCKVYTENFERSYMAYEVQHVLDVMRSDGDLTKEIKKNPMIPLLQAQSSLKTKFRSTDSFAMPKLTMEQFGKITHKSIPDTAPFFGKLTGVVLDSDFENSKNEIKLLKEKGYLNDKETALTYKAIETKDGKEKEINLIDALKSKDPNIKIVKRSEEEKQNMLYITNGLKYRYAEKQVSCFEDAYVSSYNAKNPQTKIDKFNQDIILDQNKGSFFERLFNTTSKEYKDFTKALKNYTDKDSPDFGNNRKLADAAKAYLKHKNVTDEGSIEKLDSTGRNRVKLCQTIIDAVDKAQKPVIKEIDKPVKNVNDNKIELNVTENGPEREVVKNLEQDVNIEKSKLKENNKVETKNKTVVIENDISKNN